jgi:predicted extracellular nuclease
MLKTVIRPAALLASTLLAANPASALSLVITEWLYSGSDGEFIEFTNVSASPIDLAGWAYDDDSRISSAGDGAFALDAFGVVAPFESVILTESTADAFRTAWSLPATVRIVGDYTNNLGRADEINVFDAGGNLIDRLTYGDNAIPGSIRTQDRSGRPESAAALGANDVFQWVLSSVGDVEGAFASTGGDIGSPGFTSFATAIVPLPAALPLLLGAVGGLAALRRRRA